MYEDPELLKNNEDRISGELHIFSFVVEQSAFSATRLELTRLYAFSLVPKELPSVDTLKTSTRSTSKIELDLSGELFSQYRWSQLDEADLVFVLRSPLLRRFGHRVILMDRDPKSSSAWNLEIKNVRSGEFSTEHWDKVVLAIGVS